MNCTACNKTLTDSEELALSSDHHAFTVDYDKTCELCHAKKRIEPYVAAVNAKVGSVYKDIRLYKKTDEPHNIHDYLNSIRLKEAKAYFYEIIWHYDFVRYRHWINCIRQELKDQTLAFLDNIHEFYAHLFKKDSKYTGVK